MTLSSLNEYFKTRKTTFQRIEFERGLGLIDDAFFLSLESDGVPVVIRVITNLRFIRKGTVLLRYLDLFLDKKGKEMTKKEYQSQIDIEKSLLEEELALVNKTISGKEVGALHFYPTGDLKVSFGQKGSIEAADDLDFRKEGRVLYEIGFFDVVPNGIIIFEKDKKACTRPAEVLEAFPETEKDGRRLLLKR